MEELVEGRELYVGLIGNDTLDVLPLTEMTFGEPDEGEHRIATYKAKWDEEYRKRKKILAYHGIRVPAFAEYHPGDDVVRPSELRFPLIVKPLLEDASVGICRSPSSAARRAPRKWSASGTSAPTAAAASNGATSSGSRAPSAATAGGWCRTAMPFVRGVVTTSATGIRARSR